MAGSRSATPGSRTPYVIVGGSPPRALQVPGSRFPLGSRREVEYGSLEGRLEPGERLLLFTDGLPEAPTATGDPIGYLALEKLLSADSVSADVFVDRLFDRLRAATAPVLEDDWTAVAVERI